MHAAYGYKKMINTPKIYKMRIEFSCADGSFAQRNTFNAVRQMVLASGLAYEPAKINKNWPRLAYGPAAGFGLRTEREYLDIYLTVPSPVQEVQQKLAVSAPKGLTLLSVARVPYALPSVQNLAAAAVYRVEGNFSLYDPEKTAEDFFNGADVLITRCAQNGLTLTQDVKPYVKEGRTVSSHCLKLTTLAVAGKWLRPQVLVAAWLGLEIPPQDDTFAVEGFTFIREGLFWQDSEGELHPI